MTLYLVKVIQTVKDEIHGFKEMGFVRKYNASTKIYWLDRRFCESIPQNLTVAGDSIINRLNYLAEFLPSQ